MKMDKDTLEQLKTIPIESLGSRLGLIIHHHKCCCPFHADRNPSGSFSSRTNLFKCFSCGTTADTIALTQQVLGVGFKEACEFLMKEQGTIIEQHPPLVATIKNYPPDLDFLRGLMKTPFLNAPARAFLFDERQYDEKVISWLSISSISQPTPCWRYGRPFYDAPSLLIPYKDMEGNIMNVQSRYLGISPPKGGWGVCIPRFRFPPNGSVRLFNLPMLKFLNPHDDLWICEGPSDTMAHLSAAHKCIGIPSATSVKPDDLACLPYFVRERGVTLHCAPDNDSAGSKMFESLLKICTRLQLPLVRHQIPPGYKDFSDFYGRVKDEHNNNFELPIIS